MKSDADLTRKNPVVVFRLMVMTLGLYIIPWGQYVIRTLNCMEGKKISNLPVWTKYAGVFLAVFFNIFIFFYLYGPAFSGKNGKGPEWIFVLLFFVGLALACGWLIFSFVFIGYVNYRIDRIMEDQFSENAKPLLSAVIAVCFSTTRYTQMRLNKLISLNSDRHYVAESGSLNRGENDVSFIAYTILGPLFAVIIIVAMVIIPNLSLNRWEKDVRPCTDAFLKRMNHDDYVGLVDLYAADSPVTKDELVRRLKKFVDDTGGVRSFKYRYRNSSYGNGLLSGLFLYYVVETYSGRGLSVHFSMVIDKKAQKPYRDKIEDVEAYDASGARVLYLPLNSGKVKEKDKGDAGNLNNVQRKQRQGVRGSALPKNRKKGQATL